ncbi:hypothetical protein X975_16760, partial [Stegodyphus mimosarum]
MLLMVQILLILQGEKYHSFSQTLTWMIFTSIMKKLFVIMKWFSILKDGFIRLKMLKLRQFRIICAVISLNDSHIFNIFISAFNFFSSVRLL